jgi:hypothetical protein
MSKLVFLAIILLTIISPANFLHKTKAVTIINTFYVSDLQEIDTKLLCQSWVHFFEEQTTNDSVQIYHSKEFKDVRPSRFRMQYTFHEDGQCDWLFLAPDDGHYFKKGNWNVSKENNILEIVKDGKPEKYKITKLTSDTLYLKPIKPTKTIQE